MPSDLDSATTALVAAPYSQLWNLNAPNDAGFSGVIEDVAVLAGGEQVIDAVLARTAG